MRLALGRGLVQRRGLAPSRPGRTCACTERFQESIAASTSSGWCTTSTGPSAIRLSCESVTSTAISMMRSLSGTRPVISMSIQIRLFGVRVRSDAAAMPYSLTACAHTCATPFTWLFLAALLASTRARACGSPRARCATCARIATRCRSPSPARSRSPRTRRPPTTRVAKTRLGMADACLSRALVLALTFGGVLQWLSDAWARVAPRVRRHRARRRAHRLGGRAALGCSSCRSPCTAPSSSRRASASTA